jgi:hypothetical protein
VKVTIESASGAAGVEVERLASAAIRRLAEAPASAIEHNRARVHAWRRAAERRSSFDLWARRLAESQMVGGDVLLATFELPQIRGVGVVDVQQAAQSLLGEAPMSQASPAPAPRPATGRTRLGPREALLRLARLAGEAPQTSSALPAPNVERFEIGPEVTLSVVRLPGIPLAHVETAGQEAPASADWPEMAPASAPAPLPSTVADYLSYRAAELEWIAGGVALRLPAEFAPQALEIQAKLLADSPFLAPPPYRLIAVGDVEPADLAEFARELWANRPPTTRPAVEAPASRANEAPASRASAARASPASEASGGLRVRWRAGAPTECTIRLVVRLAPEEAGGVLAETIAWLMGAPVDCAALDGVTEWSWRASAVDPRSVEISSRRATVDAVAEAQRMIERLAELREGRFGAEELAQAARLARASRMIRLQDPSAIAAALRAGEEDPWNAGGDVAREGVCAALGMASESALFVAGGTAPPAGLEQLGQAPAPEGR